MMNYLDVLFLILFILCVSVAVYAFFKDETKLKQSKKEIDKLLKEIDNTFENKDKQIEILNKNIDELEKEYKKQIKCLKEKVRYRDRKLEKYKMFTYFYKRFPKGEISLLFTPSRLGSGLSIDYKRSKNINKRIECAIFENDFIFYQKKGKIIYKEGL